MIGREGRLRVFERGEYVRFYLANSLTKKGKTIRDGMVMEDEGRLSVEVRDLHSQYTHRVSAGHVWTVDGQPGAEPEVSVTWSNGGLLIVCSRPGCLVDEDFGEPPIKVWWSQVVPGTRVLPERLQYLVDEHLKTHSNS